MPCPVPYMEFWWSERTSSALCRGVQAGRAMAGEGASAAAQETQLHDGVHAQGDGGGHQHVQRPQPRRQGRLRPGLQRRPQGWPGACLLAFHQSFSLSVSFFFLSARAYSQTHANVLIWLSSGVDVNVSFRTVLALMRSISNNWVFVQWFMLGREALSCCFIACICWHIIKFCRR